VLKDLNSYFDFDPLFFLLITSFSNIVLRLLVRRTCCMVDGCSEAFFYYWSLIVVW